MQSSGHARQIHRQLTLLTIQESGEVVYRGDYVFLGRRPAFFGAKSRVSDKYPRDGMTRGAQRAPGTAASRPHAAEICPLEKLQNLRRILKQNEDTSVYINEKRRF